MPEAPTDGVTLDELIEVAHVMGCELHVEFVPKCAHTVRHTRLVPPGIILSICQECGRVVESNWWTRSNG